MDVKEKYNSITKRLIEKRLTVTTMESVTSGLVASLITDTEGSSAAFKGGFITYSNEAKINCGVPEDIIDRFGVYSRETACSMAQVCRNNMKADIGIGVTGSLANKDPANEDSVPGQVYFAISHGTVIDNFEIRIEEEGRYNGKMCIADRIADELLKILC